MGFKSLITSFLVLLVCFCIIIDIPQDNNYVIISLPHGLIKGKLTKSIVSNSSTKYFSFLGIRYAQPPVGSLRFKKPEKLHHWKDVYDATYEKQKCYQVGIDDEMQNEDCLFLNIFTPQLPETNFSTLLPVIFHIHGGGFIQGSGLISEGYGPDFFMDYGVIFVSINYRLGPFGFMSTGDDIMPGNAGLKDQNFALKWVQENIRYFGGDPNRVTLLGWSAGAASASYHILSEKSKRLFQAAILQSGSALNPGAYQRHQTNITYSTASLISKDVDVYSFTSEKLLDYLQSVDASALHKASSEFSSKVHIIYQVQQGFHFAPVTEPIKNDSFITQSMYDLFESGQFTKVPVIIGANAEESMSFYDENFHQVQEDFDADINLCVPNDMHLTEHNKSIVAMMIKNEYIGKYKTWSQNIAGSIQYSSDQCNMRSFMKQAELQSKYTDVYAYVFSYHGYMGGNQITFPGLGNVTHGEELSYLYPRTFDGISTGDLSLFPDEDLKTRYRLLSLWTNFAKYFNPTPILSDGIDLHWPKLNFSCEKKFHYLDIGKDLNVKINPNFEKYQFWQRIYDQYSRPR